MKLKIFTTVLFASLLLGSAYVSAEEVPTTEPTEAVTTTVTTVTEDTTTTTVTEITTTTVTEVTTTTTTTEASVYLLGDVNEDGIVNVRDCAFIARKLAEGKANELLLELADFNGDGKVNVRDCSNIANELGLKLSSGKPKLQKPVKSDYNTSTHEGMKAYINDTVRYEAFTKYGITAVAFDDSVDVWDYSWDVPEEFIPNAEGYLAEEEDWMIEGWSVLPLFRDSTYEQVLEGMLVGLDMMVDEMKVSETDNMVALTPITLCWKPYVSEGNYRVYLLWNTGVVVGNKEFNTIDEYKEYYNITDEQYEWLKETYYKAAEDYYNAGKWSFFRTIENRILNPNGTKTSDEYDFNAYFSWEDFEENVLNKL